MKGYSDLIENVKTLVEDLGIEKNDKNIDIISNFYGKTIKFVGKQIIDIIKNELEIEDE